MKQQLLLAQFEFVVVPAVLISGLSPAPMADLVSGGARDDTSSLRCCRKKLHVVIE